MSTLHVHWHHRPFDHDSGERGREAVGVASTRELPPGVVRTGVLTDEHQEVTDGRPILVEDATGRTYRAADLPPETSVHLEVGPAATTEPGTTPELLEKARNVGFQVTE